MMIIAIIVMIRMKIVVIIRMMIALKIDHSNDDGGNSNAK